MLVAVLEGAGGVRHGVEAGEVAARARALLEATHHTDIHPGPEPTPLPARPRAGLPDGVEEGPRRVGGQVVGPARVDHRAIRLDQVVLPEVCPFEAQAEAAERGLDPVSDGQVQTHIRSLPTFTGVVTTLVRA